jgi:hypothetical protein
MNASPCPAASTDSALPANPADLATVARLAAEQLQTRQLLRPEREPSPAMDAANGATGVQLVVAAFLRHLRAGVQDAAFAELHHGLLGVESGGFVLAEQLATIGRLERALHSTAASRDEG